MRSIRAVLHRLLAVWRRARLERDLDDELSFHLAMVEEEQRRSGAAPELASAAARRRFGGFTQIKEQTREVWLLGWLERLLHVTRFALRGIRRSPGFAAAAIGTLALGIGATTATFMLVNGLLLRPLPVHEPDRLVRLTATDAAGRDGYLPLSLVEEIRHQQLFDGLCAFLSPLSTIQIENRLSAVSGLALSGDCFVTLGIRPAIGRLFAAEDDREGAPGTVVLSYETWQAEFGGRTDVLGRHILIDGKRMTVIGVTARRFNGLLVGFPAKLLYPLTLALPADQPARHNADVFARLPSRRTIQQAAGRLTAMSGELLARTVPDTYAGSERDIYLKRRLTLTSASTGLDASLRGRFERPLFALLVVSGLVLLISTVSVANLFLARLLQRQHEYAVRVALGAGTGRLVTQGVAESGALLAAAVCIGLLFAHAAASFLVQTYASTSRTFGLDLTTDVRIIAFSTAAALSAVVCCVILPTWRVSRVAPAAVLQMRTARSTGDRSRLRQMLVVTQMAVATVLLVLGIVFGLTLRELSEIPLGFDAQGALYARLAPLPGGYDPPFAPGPHYRALLDRLKGLPLVRAAGVAHAVPLAATPPELVAPAERPDATTLGRIFRVSEGLVDGVRLPLIAGRDFSASDAAPGARTAMVSQALAKQLFGDRDVLGRYVRIGVNPGDPPFEVIGITNDATLDDPKAGTTPAVFLNFWQQDSRYQQYPWVVLRADARNAEVVEALRTAVGQAGREYVRDVRSFDDVRRATLVDQRLLAVLAAAFGVVGLVLALVGLVGLLNVLVASRTREVGIRVALGATRWQAQWWIVRQAMLATSCGGILGLGGVWLGRRTMSALLFGISPLDGGVVIVTIATLMIAAGLASWIPVRRAALVDPVMALRSE